MCLNFLSCIYFFIQSNNNSKDILLGNKVIYSSEGYVREREEQSKQRNPSRVRLVLQTAMNP